MRPPTRPTAALAIVLLGLAAVAAADESPYAGGDRVTIEGRVTDGTGKPLAGVSVALEASRDAWSFRRLGRVQKEPTRLTTVSDDAGAYSLVWPWHDFYNRFFLLVGIEVDDEQGRRLREVERLDITPAVFGGSPVAAPVVVEDASFIREHQAFVAGLDSDAKRSQFEAMGRPGRIDRDTSGEREVVTWWYFRRGKAFRFVDGSLERVIEFDPVTSF